MTAPRRREATAERATRTHEKRALESRRSTPSRPPESHAGTATSPSRRPPAPRLARALRVFRTGIPIPGRYRNPFATGSFRMAVVSISRMAHRHSRIRDAVLRPPSENTQVVHSLIEIAHSRGWTEVSVTGTERFRQEAWRQARIAGLAVRGYRPSEVEQAQLIRALARRDAPSAERVDSISADAPPESPTPPAAPRPDGSPRADTASQGSSRERIVGKLAGSRPGRLPPRPKRGSFLFRAASDARRSIVRFGARTSNARS